ncbi:MAG: NifB/NifX family molybdenum-iron cluster-binding protein [Candidatus Bathyarchaeia archaeon]|jgi:predicted Fe-Mo cluster-binding NifX family protein
MTNRIVIPSEDQNGLNAHLAEHFGRAPYFTVVDIDDNGNISNVKPVVNVSEHRGGTGVAPDHILALQPNAVIVYDMGMRAIDIFRNARVSVLRANADKVGEVVTAYKENKLQELTEGCGHEHHQ